MQHPTKSQGFWLVAASIVMSLIFIGISTFRQLTSLENTLLQIFSLALGLTGSFIIGREGAKKAAEDMIKPHARSAFRRVLSLYNSLSRLATAIENQKEQMPSNKAALHSLQMLQGIVIEQLSTADDALEDWKDILPEELNKVGVNSKRELTIGANENE
ncbi:hypothetical protein [Acidovorax sp. SDU_ACID1]|uniref:hypothetical protein n=1 Tax=Acidovorax sp. SDU_ACID1 TaxID=3136632 RepID=UPI00387361F0